MQVKAGFVLDEETQAPMPRLDYEWKRKQRRIREQMDDDVVEAISKLVDYLEHDEGKDYASSSAKRRENHIYESIIVVANWFGLPLNWLGHPPSDNEDD